MDYYPELQYNQNVNMSAKILVVDDDPDILEAVTLILESQGYQVVTAQNGLEGLAQIKAEEPDLMILDLLMPKMDGFALFKELQDPKWLKYKDMPILILSSVREEASRRRYELETGVELEMADYIEKPFSPDVLLKRVGELISKKAKSQT
ncbi:MAG: response regulator [Dehalococcoidia bacterium]|nr:response regulator [Dehalococcoidia bacterium]